MFIVKKKIKGKEYFYARESKRVGKKVKAVTIAYLGNDEKKAREKFQKLLKENEDKIDMKKKQDVSSEEKQKINSVSIEEMARFCKRKGFVFQSSEIYGGFSGFWDFGPLGVELFNNIKKEWWKFFVQKRENIVGIEASIISHSRTWKASGHLDSFSDVAVVCEKCGKSSKIDKSEVGKARCEYCGEELKVIGEFNLLFKTKVGALNAVDAYLRGETAQGMFLNMKAVYETSRLKLPFGIAQIGRCFRNEIAPRDFLFRSREFNIAEFEFFINPDDFKCELLDKDILNLEFEFLDKETQQKGDDKTRKVKIKDLLNEKRLDEWHAYWLAQQLIWLRSLGLEKLRVREHTREELSHYSSATFDIDYEYPFGFREIAGNANRGQYDLTQHQKESGKDLSIFDDKVGKKVLPRVIEPTFGMERVFLAVICNGYYYDKERENIVLKLPLKIAPYLAAVFPLVRADKKLVEVARKIFENLKEKFNVFYDDSGSIGRRYARQDEIGTPFCITVDSQTLQDDSVTIRDRDTKKQVRVKISRLKDVLEKLLEEELSFEEVGESVE